MPASAANREAAVASLADSFDPAAAGEDPTPEIDLTKVDEPEGNTAIVSDPEPTKPSTEEKPKEKPAEEDEEKTPEEQAAAQRKELAAERLARAMSRDERSVKRELEAKQALSEVQAMRAELEKERASITALRENLKNPETRIQTAQELGLSYEAYTKAYLNGSKRTAEDDVRDLQARLDRVEQEKQEALKQSQTQSYQSAINEAAAYVEATPEKFPTLYGEHSTQEIRSRFHKAVQDLNQYNAGRRAKGQEPEIYSDEQIATFLEEEAKKEYDAKEARRSRVRGPGSSVDSAPGKSAGKVITSETANGSSQRALTREERRALALKSPWPT